MSMKWTKDDIIRDIRALFGDTSQPASKTLADMREIKSEVEVNIGALLEDGVEEE